MICHSIYWKRTLRMLRTTFTLQNLWSNSETRVKQTQRWSMAINVFDILASTHASCFTLASLASRLFTHGLLLRLRLRLLHKCEPCLTKLKKQHNDDWRRRMSNLGGGAVNFLPEISNRARQYAEKLPYFPIVFSENFPEWNGFLPYLGGGAIASCPQPPTFMTMTDFYTKTLRD